MRRCKQYCLLHIFSLLFKLLITGTMAIILLFPLTYLKSNVLLEDFQDP